MTPEKSVDGFLILTIAVCLFALLFMRGKVAEKTAIAFWF